MTVVKRRVKPVDAEMISQYAEDAARLHRLQKVVTLVDDGKYVVGWDTCGRCFYHIKICNCPSGSTPPEYIKRWVAKPS